MAELGGARSFGTDCRLPCASPAAWYLAQAPAVIDAFAKK
jgi:hypothetical protein